jgi:hypothetical protein
MELTRRDAVVALGGFGLTGTAWLSEGDGGAETLSAEDVDDLVALAETLYPSEVTVETGFVETYAAGQRELDADHAAGVADALETVRQHSRRRSGRALTALTPDQRGEILRATGADRAYPDSDGTDAERVRYYIINNLLYALYTTPTGGELVGNPNPPGHPGGTTAYQEAFPDE